MSKKISTIISTLFIFFLLSLALQFYSVSQDEVWSRDFSLSEISLKESAQLNFGRSIFSPHLSVGGYYLSNGLLALTGNIYARGFNNSIAEEIFYRMPVVFITLLLGLGVFGVIFRNIRKKQEGWIFLGKAVLLWAVVWIFFYQFNNFYNFDDFTFVSLSRSACFCFFLLIVFNRTENILLIPAVLSVAFACPWGWLVFIALLSARLIVGKENSSLNKNFNAVLTVGIVISFGLFISSVRADNATFLLSPDFWAKARGWWSAQTAVLFLSIAALLASGKDWKKSNYVLIWFCMAIIYGLVPFLDFLPFGDNTIIWQTFRGVVELIYPFVLLAVALNVSKNALTNFSYLRAGAVALGVLIAAISLWNRLTLEEQTHISFHRPKSFIPLVLTKNNPEKVTKRDLVKQLVYYRWQLAYKPRLAEAQGIMGYCSYRLGRGYRAIVHYKKAAALNPKFFWYPYNLGVIYFKSGQQYLALDYFHKALSASAKETFSQIMDSDNTYLPILHSLAADDGNFFETQFKSGHHNAFLLSAVSYYMLDDMMSMTTVVQRAIDNEIDQSGEFFYLMSFIMHNQKNYGKSLAFLQQAMVKNTAYAAYLQMTIELSNRQSVTKEVLDYFFDNVGAVTKDLANKIDIEIF